MHNPTTYSSESLKWEFRLQMQQLYITKKSCISHFVEKKYGKANGKATTIFLK